jgi:hypothetical protein
MANKFKDLTGQTFNDLTAVRRIGSDAEGNSVWEWSCVCGNIVEFNAHAVKRGHTLSCGCRRQRSSDRFAVENEWAENRSSKCSKCLATKLHTEFRKQYRKSVAFPRAWCITCDNAAHKQSTRNTPEKKLAWALRNIKYKCFKANMPFGIKIEDFLPIPMTCPALGTPMNYNDGREAQPTFDKKIPALGYVPGNVQLISHRANRIKNDATLAELESIVAWMKALDTASGPC